MNYILENFVNQPFDFIALYIVKQVVFL